MTAPNKLRDGREFPRMKKGGKMKINRTGPIITLVIGTFIIFANTVYAGDSMGGLGQALAWLAICVYLEIFSIIVWFIIHIFSKSNSRIALIVRSFFDLIIILINLNSLLIVCAIHGIEFGFSLQWVYYSRIIPVLIVLFIFVASILYLMNQWITTLSRFRRVIIHLLQCTLITFFLLIIFFIISGTISKPIARWFVNPEELILKYDDPVHNIIYEPGQEYGQGRVILWSEYYGFDKETIAFYKFEKSLYESSEYEVLKLNEKPAIRPSSNNENTTDIDEQKELDQKENEYAVNNYLILQDIGDYKLRKKRKNILTKQIKITPGYTIKVGKGVGYHERGILAGGHLMPDHEDVFYKAEYTKDIDNDAYVFVVRHNGGESDKWLQFELVGRFMAGKQGKEKILTADIDGNKVLTNIKRDYTQYEDVTYGWLHNDVVITILYDRKIGQTNKPSEIISAYLKKFPSTIQPVDIKKWKQDRVVYTLWLGKKWLEQIENIELVNDKILRVAMSEMFSYLRFREEQYNIKALDDKKKLWKLYLAKDLPQINKFVADNEQWLAQEVKK